MNIFYQKVSVELLFISSKSKSRYFWWGLGTKTTLFRKRKEKSFIARSSVVWPVFRSNAEGALRVDLSTRFAIVEPVIGLIRRPPRRSTIAGPWMRSRSVNLGPTRRTRGRVAGGST